MAKKIGAILALDGEKEFTNAVRSAQASLSKFKAESAGVKQAFSGQQNTLDALTKKHDALAKVYDATKAKQEAVQKALDNAKKNYNDYGKEVAKLETQRDEEAKKLDALKSKYGENSDEVRKQQAVVDELSRKLADSQAGYEAAGDAVQKWGLKLTQADTETQKANNALQQNDRYLEEAKNATDKVAKSIDKYGKEVKETSEEMKNMGESSSTMAEKISLLVGGGILIGAINMLKKLGAAAVDAAKQMIKVGSDFEMAMSRVEAISGASGDQLDQMQAKAKELGSSTRFSATEVASAFEYMSLAGWKTSDMLESIDGVLNLAASSGMELAQASDMVTDYLSAFGLSAEYAATMADELAYAQANSNTTAAQLGEAYGNSAAILNTAGQSIETTTALLEAMANQGKKGSEAGTALGAIVTQMTQKMKDGAIAIGGVNVAIMDEQGNYRDLVDIISDVNAATEGMGTAEKSAALNATFNKTAIQGLNLILNEGIDKVYDYRDALGQAGGSAKDMAGTMQDNLQGAVTEMKSALEGLGIAAYEYVDGPLVGAVDGITEGLSRITDFITPQRTELEKLIDSTKESNRAVRDMLDGLADTGGVDESIAVMEHYKDVLKEAADGAKLNSYQQEEVSRVVSDLSGTVPELAAAWDSQNGVLNLTNAEIEKLISNSEAYLRQQAAMEAKKEAFDALYAAELNAAKAETAVARAQAEYNAAVEAQTRANTEATASIDDYSTSAADAVENLDEAKRAQDEANRAAEEARQIYDDFDEALQKANAAMGDTAAAAQEASDAQQDMASNGAEAINDLSEEYIQFEDSIRKAITSAIDLLSEFEGGQEVTADELEKNLESQIAGMQNWADNMETLAGAAGSGMTQEFYDYLAQMGPQSANLVQTLVDTLAGDEDKFKDIVAKWGEAMKMDENAEVVASYTSVGKGIVDKTTEGIDKNKDKAKKAVTDTMNAAKQAGDSATYQFYSPGYRSVDEMARGVRNNSSFKDALLDQADDALAALNNKIRNHKTASVKVSSDTVTTQAIVPQAMPTAEINALTALSSVRISTQAGSSGATNAAVLNRIATTLDKIASSDASGLSRRDLARGLAQLGVSMKNGKY